MASWWSRGRPKRLLWARRSSSSVPPWIPQCTQVQQLQLRLEIAERVPETAEEQDLIVGKSLFIGDYLHECRELLILTVEEFGPL